MFELSKDDTLVLKGVAICAMLFHHLFWQHPEYGWLIFQIALIGKVCVSIFLFLSGYGLSVQYEKKYSDSIKSQLSHIAVFLYRRICRFYVHYWAVFIVSISVGVFILDRSLSVAYGEQSNILISLIKDLFGVQGFDSYNVTWWFNSLIIGYYFLFPVLYHLLRNWRYTLILSPLLAFVSPYLFAFALGIGLSINRSKVTILLKSINAYLVLALSLSLLLILIVNRQFCYFDLLSGIGADPLITVALVLFYSLVVWKFGFRFRILSFLGSHSTNIYLLHTFIYFYFFPNLIYWTDNPFLIFLTLLSISLLLSFSLEYIKKLTKYKKFEDWLIGLFSQSVN